MRDQRSPIPAPERRGGGAARRLRGRLGSGGPGRQGPPRRARSQRLQLVRLHPAHSDRRLQPRVRYPRQLRRLRLERDPRDQAAHRAHQLRRRGAVRRLPRAPAPGRGLSEARQVAAAESQECRSGSGARGGALRPRQPVCRRLHVDHLGRGLQRRRHQARLPDAPTDSWRMLFDPVLVSRFQDCGVSMLDAPSEVVGTVLLFLGRNPNSNSPDDLKAAEQVLRAMRPYVRYVDSSRYIDMLANADICLVMGWSGDIKQAHDRARDAGKGIDVAYSIPKEGAIANYDVLAIPRDAPHVRNAHLFIDYLLRPDVAARNSNLIKYANSVQPALEPLDPGVRSDPGVYPPAEVRARLVPERARPPEFQRLLTRMWTRFKTGK